MQTRALALRVRPESAITAYLAALGLLGTPNRGAGPRGSSPK